MLVCQDEAFQLWTEDWGNLYEKGSRSYKIIQGIVDTWYLISVVENDYVKGDLFATLLSANNSNHDRKDTASDKANSTGEDPAQVDEVAAAWNPASEGQEPALAANGQR